MNPNSNGCERFALVVVLEIQNTRKREMEHVDVVRRKRSFVGSNPTYILFLFFRLTDHI